MPSSDKPALNGSGNLSADYVTNLALVTGGAKRVGAVLAERLAILGFDLALHFGKSAQEANDLASHLASRYGVQVKTYMADFSVAGSAQHLFAQVLSEQGCPAVLINNASRFEPESLATFNEDKAQASFGLQTLTPIVLIKLMAQALSDRRGQSNKDALVVNMLDQRVLNPTPGFLTYNLTKSALAAMTKPLASELAPHIRLMGIAPGPVLPPPYSDGTGFNDYCKAMPLKRGSPPEQIVLVLEFLLRAHASTGQIISSDGGQHMGYLSPDEAIRDWKIKHNTGA